MKKSIDKFKHKENNKKIIKIKRFQIKYGIHYTLEEDTN